MRKILRVPNIAKRFSEAEPKEKSKAYSFSFLSKAMLPQNSIVVYPVRAKNQFHALKATITAAMEKSRMTRKDKSERKSL